MEAGIWIAGVLDGVSDGVQLPWKVGSSLKICMLVAQYIK